MVHNVSLSVSPINRERFEVEFRRRNNQEIKNEDGIDKLPSRSNYIPLEGNIKRPSRDFFWAIRHPILVWRLVKSYHMISNTALAIYVLYLLILFHLCIKSLIHSLVTGTDRKLLKYFDDIYYPHMAGSAPEPHLFNNLFLSFSIFCFCVRLGCLYKLIKLSIINEFYYSKLSITQANYSYLATFKLSISEWIKLWKELSNHQKSIYSSKSDFIKHLKFTHSTNREYIKLNQNDLLFRFNMVDFEECYSNTIIGDSKKRIEYYNNWHFNKPLDRMSVRSLMNTIIIAVLGQNLIIHGVALSIIGYIHLELSSSYSEDYMSQSITEIFASLVSHFSKPIPILRSIEVFTLIGSQVPQIFDSFLVALDVCTLESRTRKLREIFELELEIYRNKATKLALDYKNYKDNYQFNIDYSTTLIEGTPNERFDPSALIEIKHKQQFNMRILHNIKLVRLLYLEFLSIKENHSLTLNFIMLSSGIGMSFALSLMFACKTIAEMIMIIMAFACCLLPSLAGLIYCAKSERSVSWFLILFAV